MTDYKINIDSLVAHRGLQHSYPENTILSLKKAIEFGARHIELDVQFSSDFHPVIYHDSDLQRVSAQLGNIWQYSRQKLLQLPAYEPERLGDRFKAETIAPLEALVTLLQENPQVNAFVELKQESIEHCGREVMLNSVSQILEPVKSQAVIISYDYRLVQIAREQQSFSVGVVLEHWQDLHSEPVQSCRPDYIFVDREIMPDEIDSKVLEMATLVAYEVGDIALAKELIAKGFTMLETFEMENLATGQQDMAQVKTYAT